MNVSEMCLEKMSTDMIYLRGEVNDAVVGPKEINGKLDTLIALAQAGSQLRPSTQQKGTIHGK